MNDTDRRVSVEAPEPEWIRDLLEDGHEGPDLTPERSERLDRRLAAALAEQRRGWERERRTKVAVGGAFVALVALAAAVALWLRLTASPELDTARSPDPAPATSARANVARQPPVKSGDTPKPPSGAPQPPVDGGRPPGR